MGTEKAAAVVEKEQGSLYCLYTDGTIKKHVEKVSISNGLAWSADNKTMYYIDSIPRCVYAFDYDIENGTLSKYTDIYCHTSEDFIRMRTRLLTRQV